MGRHRACVPHKLARGGRRGPCPTDLDPAPRLRGQIEARLAPPVLGAVFGKELRRLDAIVAPAQQP
jgi:hypothetical protein